MEMHHDEASGDAAPEMAEVEPDAEPGVRGWVRHHRRPVQVAVAVLVGLAVFAVSAIANGPDREPSVETADGDDERSDRASVDSQGREPGDDVDEADGGDDGGGGGGGGGGDPARRAERRAERAAERAERQARGDRDGDRDREGRPSRPPGGGGTVPPPTTPTSRSLTAGPSPLPAFAAITATPSGPCPSGTTTVQVSVVAVGGSLDGRTLVTREVAAGADGGWSLPPFAVPAVRSVPEVAWAATADQVEVRASCGADGATYAAAQVALSAIGEPPDLTATLAADLVEATLAGCPTAARLHLVAGAAPPPPGEDLDATTTVDMVRDSSADPWTAVADAPDLGSGEGLWATASCLHQASGTVVWRTLPVELVAP